MNKFEIIENSLVVTNTATNKVVYDAPKSDVYYVHCDLTNGKITIYDTSSSNKHGAEVYKSKLSDSVDENDTPFTEETFIEFARKNLGFDSTSSNTSTATGGATNLEDTDGDALEINEDGSINASAGDLQRVKAQGDLKRTYAKLDVGTNDERFDTITYESAILGFKVTVQFNYEQLTVNGVTFYNQTDDVATKSNI